MSQCERILNRLQSGPITPMEAWSELGVYRLAARCHDLREAGHNVVKQMVSVNNRFGESCRVAQYALVK